jgi:hypothetical protein
MTDLDTENKHIPMIVVGLELGKTECTLVPSIVTDSAVGYRRYSSLSAAQFQRPAKIRRLASIRRVRANESENKEHITEGGKVALQS